MRSTIIVMFLAAFGTVTLSFAQDIPESQVPSVVLNAFKLKFNNATKVEWELKGEQYKAEFEIGKRDHDVWMDKNGNVAKHKEDFPKAELPAAIRQKIEADFKAYKIDDVDKIDTAGKVVYQVELDGTTDDRKILFTPDGKIESNIAD